MQSVISSRASASTSRARRAARTAFILSLLLLAALAASAATAAGEETREAKRLDDAREAYLAIKGTEDAGIPERLLEKCRCVAVFPGVVKGAIGWGGRRGSGVMTCRDSAGVWSAPTFLTLTGGSVGLQIGVEKADVLLFVMNEKGARSMTHGEFTVGAKGSIAAGPVGRTAEGATDIKLDAEIYSYARSKGLFAGLSLEGAHLGNDLKAIERYYGKPLTPQALLFERPAVELPGSAEAFLKALP
jgi:lipid-binding SYLF domain-containing protein